MIEARTFSRKQAGLRFARHHAWWHSSAGSLRAGVQSLISRDDGKRKRRDRSNKKKKRTTALTLSQTAQSPPTDHGGVGSVWLRRTAHAARHERGGRRGASHDSCVTSRRNESVRRSVCAQRSHAGVAWSVAIVLCGSPCGVCVLLPAPPTSGLLARFRKEVGLSGFFIFVGLTLTELHVSPVQ